MAKNLREGSVAKNLAKLSFPMMFGILSIFLFNLTDTLFLGHYGTKELAAISFIFPVVAFCGSLILGLAGAVSAVVSRFIGQRKTEEVQVHTTSALLLAVLIAVVLNIVGLPMMERLFSTMGAQGETLELVKDYIYIWFPGLVLVSVPMVGNGGIRAAGDAITASAIMIIAAISNFVLDPIMIFGYLGVPALGIKGAAIATVFSRGITMVLSLSVLHFKYKMINLKLLNRAEIKRTWKNLLATAIPLSLSNIINPLVISVVMGMIARLGESAVAAFGIVARIESIALIPLISIQVGMGPFVGQNFGARMFERIKEGLKISFLFAISWQFIIAVLFFFIGHRLVYYFTSDISVLDQAKDYFMIVPYTYFFLSLSLITHSTLTSLNHPRYATMMTILTLVVLYIPGVYFFINEWQLEGVFMAQALVNFLGGLMAIGFLYFLFYRKIKVFQ